MTQIKTILLAGVLLGLSGCGNVETHTTVKKETKIDSNGNEKTKIETRTETIQRDSSDAPTTREVKEINVDRRNDTDPVVKVGPIEINKR